jgi:hypothetical protein
MLAESMVFDGPSMAWQGRQRPTSQHRRSWAWSAAVFWPGPLATARCVSMWGFRVCALSGLQTAIGMPPARATREHTLQTASPAANQILCAAGPEQEACTAAATTLRSNTEVFWCNTAHVVHNIQAFSNTDNSNARQSCSQPGHQPFRRRLGRPLD